jgi:hypothetical protein
MGQYYTVANVDKKEMFSPRGVKLMEHSWIGNDSMQKLYELLMTDWKKDRVVVAGDYFEAEENKDVGLGDVVGQIYDQEWNEPNISIEGTDDEHIAEQQTRFYVSYDKKEYIDLSKLPKQKDDWIVNPLSLMIACGNNRGGGDFYDSGRGYEFVGRWAGSRVGIEELAPEGFKEIRPNFKEE